MKRVQEMVSEDILYHEDTNFLEMEHWNGIVKVYCKPESILENGDREYRMVFYDGSVKMIRITPTKGKTSTFLVTNEVDRILEDIGNESEISGNIDKIDGDLKNTEYWLKKHFENSE